MRIALLVEGRTEQSFLPYLRSFLSTKLSGAMPRIAPRYYRGRLPIGDELRKDVRKELTDRVSPADAVIALTYVYTGQPPGKRDFRDATDAKRKMRKWVGDEPRFHPHAAQYEFEAWLIPYWQVLKEKAGSNRARPAGKPEQIDHERPPSARIEEVFRTGQCGRKYIKARDGAAVLRDQDLYIAVQECPELRALINTIVTLCGGEPIPD